MKIDPADPKLRWLSILGIGEDGLAGLTPAALRLLHDAVLVVGGARHLALAADAIRGESLAWPSPITDAIPALLVRRGQPVVVLASGDPFHYGIGALLTQHVAIDEILCLPHLSAFSLAASRLGWALQDVACLTIHGRALERIARHLQPNRRLMLLSWDERSPAAVAAYLTERGFGNSRLHVLEQMGGPGERLRASPANQFALTDCVPLNMLAVELVADPGALVLPLAPGLPDELFEHDGQLTKRDLRALALAALAPRAGERLWDVGGGAGSIAIEWLLRHPSLSAIAIERDPARAARITRNAVHLGVPDLEVVTGSAPDCLADLAVPDVIFLGGGVSVPGMIDGCWQALPPGGRLVAHAVTLDSEAALFDAFQRFGGAMSRYQTWQADAIGRFHGWRGAMPVTQWRAVKP